MPLTLEPGRKLVVATHNPGKAVEIATILELTESRVSQIRSKAISKLRAEMAPLREQVA